MGPVSIHISEDINSEITVNKQLKTIQSNITKDNLFNGDSKKKLTKLFSKIRPESALFTLIKLLIENHDQINLTNSLLSINSCDLDLIQKLNYCMEYFAHIPFSFHYNKVNSKVMIDFLHLKKEIDLITNLEI